MKNKKLLYGFLALGLVLTGFVVVKTLSKPAVVPEPVVEELENFDLPPADSSIVVDLTKDSAKANTVVLDITGLGGKYTGIGYDFTYESKEVFKGVNSGNNPVDITGKEEYSKEVYLGTCSRNVCTPDPGVTQISVTLVFTDTAGQKTQFSKDYDL